MRLGNLRDHIDLALPVRRVGDRGEARLTDTYGLQRSGQHLIIEWICRGYGEVVHFNHCRFFRRGVVMELQPVTGRRVVYSAGRLDDSGRQGRSKLLESLPPRPLPRRLYSMEDVDLGDRRLRRLRRSRPADVVVILRDPANWLASSMTHGRSTPEQLVAKRDLLIRYLEQALGVADHLGAPCHAVSFNRFVADPAYRSALSHALGLENQAAAEEALARVPAFGGGSSFGDPGAATSALRSGVLERWRSRADDPFFRETLREPRLRELASAFFGDLPGPYER